MELRSWWELGKGIWIALFLGYLWVAISIIFQYKVSSSGAVLICACIVSDLIFQQLKWRRLAAFVANHFCERKQGPDGWIIFETVKPNPHRVKTQEVSLDALMRLAEPGDFYENRYWMVSGTAARCETPILWCIGVSAMVGTLIWGYF